MLARSLFMSNFVPHFEVNPAPRPYLQCITLNY